MGSISENNELRQVFEYFENHENLERFEIHESMEDAMRGEVQLYSVVDNSGDAVAHIFRYDKDYQSEGGSTILEEGDPIPIDLDEFVAGFSVDLLPGYDGERVQETTNRVANSKATGYIEPHDQIDDVRYLCDFQIPKSYDTETMEETVDASVEIALQAGELQNRIDQAVDQFNADYGLNN